MSHIGDKLILAIRLVAAEMPSHSVQYCTYISEISDEPNCLVGRAMARIGVLPKKDDKYYLPRNTNDEKFDHAHVEFGEVLWDLEQKEIDWIQAVQSKQDKHMGFALAVYSADGDHPGIIGAPLKN